MARGRLSQDDLVASLNCAVATTSDSRRDLSRSLKVNYVEIIKNGSPGTGMMSFAGLPDEQVWQLIQYIRSLAK